MANTTAAAAKLTAHQRKVITCAFRLTGEINVAVRRPTLRILEHLGMVTITWWTPGEGFDPIAQNVKLTEAGWAVYREEENARYAREAREIANEVLTTRTGQAVRGLVVVGRTWDKEAGARAETLVNPTFEEYTEALGTAKEATLMSTGGGHPNTHEWCNCHGGSSAHWVRYERWSERGQEAHGYVCPNCWKLTQTG